MENCKILMWYEVFKIEKAGSQLNVNEGGQSPTKREYTIIYSTVAHFTCLENEFVIYEGDSWSTKPTFNTKLTKIKSRIECLFKLKAEYQIDVEYDSMLLIFIVHVGTNKPECDHCLDNPKKKCKYCACHKCGDKKDPNKTILCDECDQPWHLYCLTPPLDAIPEVDEW